jgi:spore maturation protein A
MVAGVTVWNNGNRTRGNPDTLHSRRSAAWLLIHRNRSVLNKIWFALLAIGIVYGFAKGAWQSAYPPTPAPAVENSDAQAPATEPAPGTTPPPPTQDATGLPAMGKKLNAAVVDAAVTSVEICIGLIGFMALWLGMLKIAKDAGLVDALARLLRPLMRWLFPEIPDGHPAQGAVLMNLSANMLGLDNAATPLGLKAMRELQELNPVKDTATNSMAMFLAINTSSITLVPFTIIGYRVLKGSHSPATPIAGTLLATIVSTLFAIFVTRWMSRWMRYQVELPEENAGSEVPVAASGGNA